jgi:hypothetical protein
MPICRLSALVLLLCVASALPARGQNPPAEAAPPASKFTFRAKGATLKAAAAELAKQTGMELDVSGSDPAAILDADFDAATFWHVVERLAEATGSRVVVGTQGKPVRLVKAAGVRAPVALDGPFRVTAKEMESRIDLQTGKTSYDLTLEISWESRLPVYRIDAHPVLSKATDDAGRPVTVRPYDARNPVSGNVAATRVRLEGLTRASKTIAVLEGSFRATAADGMLRFAFDDLTKPTSLTQKGVTDVVRKFEKAGTFWVADVEVRYPTGGAVFESFETYWLGRNTMTLTAPNGTTKFTADDEEINGSSVRYRFKADKARGLAPADLKGWTMTYETPGPLREVPVRFELKGIDLP